MLFVDVNDVLLRFTNMGNISSQVVEMQRLVAVLQKTEVAAEFVRGGVIFQRASTGIVVADIELVAIPERESTS